MPGKRNATAVEETSGLLLTEAAEPRELATGDDEESDVVDEIGKAIGLTYEENEPLRAGQKEEERDEHRWELDPASSEDYVERCAGAGAEAVPLLRMRHQRARRTSLA